MPVDEVSISAPPRKMVRSPPAPPTVPVDAKEADIEIFPPLALTTLLDPVVAPIEIP